VTWTVTNQGDAVWPGTAGWVDTVFISRDPELILSRATPLTAVVHANVGGLQANGSYTASARVRLPAGIEGPYYLHVITDTEHDYGKLTAIPGEAAKELSGARARDYTPELAAEFYRASVHESSYLNNVGTGAVLVTYREPDLQVDQVILSNPSPMSGETVAVTWTVTNRGERETRVADWFDGVYLSLDDTLDAGDYPMYAGNDQRVVPVHLSALTGGPSLKPGESYTRTVNVKIPDSISGEFRILVKADTNALRDTDPDIESTIREGLAVVIAHGDGRVGEFRQEGNNMAIAPLTVTLSRRRICGLPRC